MFSKRKHNKAVKRFPTNEAVKRFSHPLFSVLIRLAVMIIVLAWVCASNMSWTNTTETKRSKHCYSFEVRLSFSFYFQIETPVMCMSASSRSARILQACHSYAICSRIIATAMLPTIVSLQDVQCQSFILGHVMLSPVSGFHCKSWELYCKNVILSLLPSFCKSVERLLCHKESYCFSISKINFSSP